jgi:hypothetical protein
LICYALLHENVKVHGDSFYPHTSRCGMIPEAAGTHGRPE